MVYMWGIDVVEPGEELAAAKEKALAKLKGYVSA